MACNINTPVSECSGRFPIVYLQLIECVFLGEVTFPWSISLFAPRDVVLLIISSTTSRGVNKFASTAHEKHAVAWRIDHHLSICPGAGAYSIQYWV